jgi:hypothetical protein
MNIAAYGTVFNLVQNRQTLNLDQAKEILQNAFVKVGIAANNIGVSFDGKHLVPSADFMGQTHKKCEFTAHVSSQGVEICKVSQGKAKARKTVAKLQQSYTGDELAVQYILACGTIKIEGKGARSTNRGSGYTLTIDSGDTQEARSMVKRLTTIVNKDSRNDKATGNLYLTTEDEVGDVMIACGLGELFIEKAEIGEMEVWSAELRNLV